MHQLPVVFHNLFVQWRHLSCRQPRLLNLVFCNAPTELVVFLQKLLPLHLRAVRDANELARGRQYSMDLRENLRDHLAIVAGENGVDHGLVDHGVKTAVLKLVHVARVHFDKADGEAVIFVVQLPLQVDDVAAPVDARELFVTVPEHIDGKAGAATANYQNDVVTVHLVHHELH